MISDSRCALALYTILQILLASSAQAGWCDSGPPSFSILTPNNRSTVVASQPFNITWSSACDETYTDPGYDGQFCIPAGSGRVQLALFQYVAIPPSTCLTNFSAPLFWLTTTAPNTGSFLWTPPSNLTESDNYVLSGQILWKEKTLLNGVQSVMFRYLTKSTDVIQDSPVSSTVAAEVSAFVSQSAAMASWSARVFAPTSTAHSTSSSYAGSNARGNLVYVAPVWVSGATAVLSYLVGVLVM